MYLLTKMNRKSNHFMILVLLNLIGFLIIGVSAPDIIKYFLYLLFYILIPGLLIIEISTQALTSNEKLFYAFPVGLLLEFLLHLVFYGLNIQFFSLFFLPLLSIYAIYFFVKKKRIELLQPTINNFSWNLFLVSFSFFAIISWLSLYMPVGHAGTDPYFLLYQDSVWTIGNVVASLHSLIPNELRFAGYSFYYHLSQTFHLADVIYVTGVDAVDLLIRLEHITGLVYILCSLVFIANKYLTNNTYKVFFLISFFLFQKLQIAHILYNPLSYFFSMFYFLPMLYWLHSWFASNSMKNSFIFFLLLAGSIGAKASLYPIIAICFFILLIFNFKSPKTLRTPLYIGFSSFMVFLAWYILIYSHARGLTELHLTIPSENSLSGYFLFLKSFALILIKTLASHINYFWQAPILLFGLFYLLKNKRNDTFVLFATLFLFTNLFFYYLVTIEGGNAYFRMYPVVVASLGALYFLDKYNALFNKKIIYGSSTIILLLGFVYFTKSVYVWNNTQWGLKNQFLSTSELSQLRKTLSAKEYEGLQFLKENSDYDAIILTDRQAFNHSNGMEVSRFFYYSAFSERKMYLEGRSFSGNGDKDFVDLLDKRQKITDFIYTSSDYAKIGDLLQENSIDYIIQSKRFNKVSPLSNTDIVSPIFNNEDITIYKTIMK